MSQTRATQHHVSRNGETLGPWSVDVITQKLAHSEVDITDFVWDAAKNDWIMLMEFDDLKSYLHAQKPSAPPPPPMAKPTMTKAMTLAATEPATDLSDITASGRPRTVAITTTLDQPSTPMVVAPSMAKEDAIEWYIMRESRKFGPFNVYGVVKALQEKSIFAFDLIWREGMHEWVRISEHETFSVDAIRTLIATMSDKTMKQAIFAQRKHPRFQVQNDVLIHDNQTVSPGQMVEGSLGGAGLVVNNATLMPGQMIYVHFASMAGLPAFNSLGEIVSKKYTKNVRDNRAPMHYGLRFVKMDRLAEDRVHNYFTARTGSRLGA